MRVKLKRLLGLDKPRQIIAATMILAFLYVAFPRYLVATGSMETTIPRGSYVIASRLHLLFSEAATHDIVVFAPYKGISPHPWIHRIVGRAGDPILPLASPRPKGARFDVTTGHDATTTPLHSIPADFVYQAGDAPTAYHGLVPRDMIKAKVLFHFELPWSRNKSKD